ncbi:unnamed protein product [Closterium sp. NIES-54]
MYYHSPAVSLPLLTSPPPLPALPSPPSACTHFTSLCACIPLTPLSAAPMRAPTSTRPTSRVPSQPASPFSFEMSQNFPHPPLCCPHACSRLHRNYFTGSFPASISALTALTELRLNLNYLTGSMPAALPASLKVIDLSNNYLVGTFPTTTATSVACASNCLQDASKCPAGSAQRAAGGCAICQTTDGTGKMCGGGICTPNATNLIAAQIVNPDTAPLYCLGVSMDPTMGECAGGKGAGTKQVSAMDTCVPWPSLSDFCLANNWPICPAVPLYYLNATFTDCSLCVAPLPFLPFPPFHHPPPSGGAAEHEGIAGGDVHGLGIGLAVHHPRAAAAGRRLVQCRLQHLRQSHVAYIESLARRRPAPLVPYHTTAFLPLPLGSLTHRACPSLKPRAHPPSPPPHPSHRSGASYNYLYGSIPAPGAALKAIALDGNWLSGTFPGAGFSSCSATSNCLASIGACTTGGTVQRAAAACTVCDTTDGSGTVCGGGTCAPDTAAPLASSTPNSATAAVLPRFCVGVPLDATQGNILLALKTTLGATFSDWTASTLAAPKATSTQPKTGGKRRALQGRGSGLLYDWKAVGSCTIQGQTPIAGSWTGVRCSPIGQIVSL